MKVRVVKRRTRTVASRLAEAARLCSGRSSETFDSLIDLHSDELSQLVGLYVSLQHSLNSCVFVAGDYDRDFQVGSILASGTEKLVLEGTYAVSPDIDLDSFDDPRGSFRLELTRLRRCSIDLTLRLSLDNLYCAYRGFASGRALTSACSGARAARSLPLPLTPSRAPADA